MTNNQKVLAFCVGVVVYWRILTWEAESEIGHYGLLPFSYFSVVAAGLLGFWLARLMKGRS